MRVMESWTETQLYMPHNATYNTTGVPVDYQDRMGQRMTGTIKSKRFVHVDDVLEIIDGHKYSICWSATEKLWNDRMDEIKTAVLALKGGEH